MEIKDNPLEGLSNLGEFQIINDNEETQEEETQEEETQEEEEAEDEEDTQEDAIIY